MKIQGGGNKILCQIYGPYFSVINKEAKAELILEELNNTVEDVKFTIEKERTQNYGIKITKTKLKLPLYRKPNASNNNKKPNCKTSHNYKIAALRSYINRAVVIYSNQAFQRYGNQK